MALSYQAKIDLIVGGLREIKEAEQRIKKLVNESKKLKRGGVAQRGTVALASITRAERQASRRSVQIAEKRVLLSSKLNAATDLYNRKLQEAARNGAANNKTLQSRVDQIKQAFEVGTKGGQRNLKLVRALATELGRVVEKQNELNRAQSLRSKGFEAGRRGFERIAALESAGFGDVRGLSRAKTLVRGIGAAAATGDQQAYNEALRKAKAVIDRLERQYREGEKAQKDANKAKRDLAKAEREAANQQKAQKSARRRKFTDIATGFGFPLLFGGGPLQAVAGGVGGALGGFGGSIAATALVSQVEAFAQETAKVGQALGSVSGAFDLMSEKALFTSDETQLLVEAMIEQGDVAGAARKMTEELAKKIGQSGIKKLKDFGDEAKKLGGLVNTLILRFQAFMTNALTPLLKLLNSALEATDVRQRFAQLGTDLTGDRKAAFEARKRELGIKTTSRGVKGLQGKSGLEKMKTLLKEFPLESIQVTGGQITPSAADLAAASKIGTKDTDKAAREEERIKQRLAALEVERQKILEISGFKDKIAAAEALNDTQTVIRLQGQQKLGEIEAKRLSDLTKITDQRLKDAINIKAATEKLAAHREMERQLAEDQRQRQKLFEDTLRSLENQLAIETATTREEAEQLRIAQEMKALEGKGLSSEQMGRIKSAKEALSQSQEPLNKFINDSTKALNDFQQMGVTIAQGVGNAFGTAMTTGVAELVKGTKSAEEVFADFLNNIANTLMQVAQQMIATYIAIGIAKAFALGSTGGGGEASAPAPDIQTGEGFGLGNQIMVGGMRSAAAGAYIGSPTTALIGEGGEPEYVIPESKMRESMARYSRGARGSAVIPESGGSGTSGEGGGTAVATPIDVRYTVERINNVDYVTADQFQAGMKQAANQGAKQGEQQTLKRLQMSGSTRKRLGM